VRGGKSQLEHTIVGDYPVAELLLLRRIGHHAVYSGVDGA
jgi:hypothetical protein